MARDPKLYQHSWDVAKGRPDCCRFCGFMRTRTDETFRTREGLTYRKTLYIDPETGRRCQYRPCDPSLETAGHKVARYLERFEIEVETRRVWKDGARVQILLKPGQAEELLRLFETRVR